MAFQSQRQYPLLKRYNKLTNQPQHHHHQRRKDRTMVKVWERSPTVPAVLNGQVFAVDAMASLNKGIGGLVVDRRQRADVADELVQQRRLNQVRLLRDERLLGQDHLLGRHGVRGQQTPVDVTTVTQVRVVGVLQETHTSTNQVYF